MAYTKQDWRRLKSELIPVEPENLEQIEDGIVELESRIQAGLGEVETTTTTTKADYLMEKPTEDFKVLEKVPFEEGITYEAVVTIDEVESSYSVQLVDGASLNLDYYDLTGFKVLTCGDLNDTSTRGLMIIQDCIASLSPPNVTSIEGYSSVYSSYDKVVIKDAYINNKTTHKIKNQDAKYTEAFQADILCTDKKDVSFIKNNPIQKELIKTENKNKGYEIALNVTNFEVLLEDDILKIGYVKDTVTNSKIDFDVETLTATISGIDGTQTFELSVMSGEDFGFPKAATLYVAENFMVYPLIIRGLTKIKLVDDQFEFAGAVDADGLPLYDADGEMVADNDALFILSFYQPESMRTIFNSVATINETISEEVKEEEHFTVTEQFAKDFQANFAEGDSNKIGFIKNMPFYASYKSLPGFTIAESLATDEDFKLFTGTTKNSLLLDKDSNYEATLLDIYADGTIDGESLKGVYPGIVYNRTEMLEAMQAENFAYAIPESEIAALESVLPADSAMLAIDAGDIIPLIFTHIHMSIAEDGSLQVATEENAEENYFTYSNFGGTETVINITGKNIPENNYKFKQIKKLPNEFLDTNVAKTLDPSDSEKAVSGSGIWRFLTDNVRTQVLSTSDGHINFVKTDDSQNIDFSVETVGIGYNEDLQTTDKDTIVGAINELVSDINENKLQVADSGINNIYYTDKNGTPQEQLLKQNFVAAADDHTCYEALLNDTNIYWCPPCTVVDDSIYGFSTKTFNIYSLNTSTKRVTKKAVAKDIEIKDTLTQAFASSSIICVNLRISSTTEKWVYKSPISSSLDKTFTESSFTTFFEIYKYNKQHISIGFSDGIITSATITDMSEVLANLPTTLKNTGSSIFNRSSTTGATRTQYRSGKKYTVTPTYVNSYRRHILTQKAVGDTGVNYLLTTSNLQTYGDSTNSNLQLIITGDNSYELVAQRALNSEGVEIYSYEGTEYTGIDNNTHSTYIFLSSDSTSPFCLTSAGEAIWRNLNTGEILARKTVQTDSTNLFNATTLRTTKLYYCAENKLLYAVNSTSIYAININDENPTATVITESTDEFTFNDNCRLIGFGENFVLLTNGSTLKVVQIRESFNCNELKLGDTAQDKIVLKDTETGDLYNLVIKNGQVVIEAATV